MKAIVCSLVLILPALIPHAAAHDPAALLEAGVQAQNPGTGATAGPAPRALPEFLCIQADYGVGRTSEQWPKMRPDVVELVAEGFGEDDLREIIAFCKTPAGEALVTKDAKIEQRTVLEYVRIAQDALSQRAAARTARERVDRARTARGALTSKAQNPGSAPASSATPAPKAAPARVANQDRASPAEEFLSIQEAHRTGPVNDHWAQLRPGVVRYIAEIYTEDELRRIIAFYKTP